ncbi:hypothetical protein Poli38472_000036 [Pythium oligandrum]|uniref:DUF3730 domain-containing protein n=1 Tax=Pythium oligandrum TaxID=41045 RepID=A0A8K1CAY0_PYTOL|nr:hypothetical protein Poli38472_000036 [Pythium oligandrum]|eukprot:TMW59994.1 hypothetical protein Poli38472_000036 [Pythium oligandrum]
MAELKPLTALRKASHAAFHKAQEDALDALISTRSAASSQRLLDAVLAASETHKQPPHELLTHLKSAVAVCTTPSAKAEFLGFALVSRVLPLCVVSPVAAPFVQDALLDVYVANPDVLPGVLAAIEELSDVQHFEPLVPVLLKALTESTAHSTRTLALLQTLGRRSWDAEAEKVRSGIVRVFTRALQLLPRSKDPVAWLVSSSLVASTVDLLTASSSASSTVSETAHWVLSSVVHGVQQQLGVLSLLQSLRELARAFPSDLWSSSYITLCGYLLTLSECGLREQQLVLDILRVVLQAGRKTTKGTRVVYVEALVVPLVSVLPTHAKDASALLQVVMELTFTTPFESTSLPVFDAILPGEPSAHAASLLALAHSSSSLEAWLATLFHSESESVAKDGDVAWLVLALGASLVDHRGSLRLEGLKALERQLKHRRGYWNATQTKLLVSTLVFLTSSLQPSSPDHSVWLSKGFQVLATLAATTTETMKIILRLIKRMALVDALKSQALHLQMLVWKQDSRVYPYLETLLQSFEEEEEEEDDNKAKERTLVHMATILAICEKDPETGVEWIAAIQNGLEDESVGVVTMAVNAVTTLCVADCLDYETTLKILMNKMRKKKIECVDDDRFQQELCRLYALSSRLETSAKYRTKLLDELWEYTESESASVRLEAYTALVGFELVTLGLSLPDPRTAIRHTDEEDEDEEEEDLTEEEIQENVERVWTALQSEKDATVRTAIESLLLKILDAECKRLTPGSARGGVAAAASFALENRVSSAATKELKKHFPARPDLNVAEDAGLDDYRRVLLAYQTQDALENAQAKRKDRRLRVVSTQVDEMKALLDRVLAHPAPTWLGSDANTTTETLTNVLLWTEALSGYTGKLLERLHEFAKLRTPSDGTAQQTTEMLESLAHEQLSRLVETAQANPFGYLVLGALAGQARGLNLVAVDVATTALRRQLRQGVEAARVFKDKAHEHHVELLHVTLGMLLSLTKRGEDKTVDDDVALLLSMLHSQYPALLRASVLLCVSHLGALIAGEGAETLVKSANQLHNAQSRAKPIADAVWRVFLESAALASEGEMFPMSEASASVKLRQQPNSAAVDPLVAHASLLSLSRLSQSFASLKRLSWLESLSDGLIASKTSCSSEVPVVLALGPVLFECVKYNLVSSKRVYELAAELLDHQQSNGQSLVAVGFVLRAMAAADGIVNPSLLESFVRQVETSDDSALALLSLFGSSTGVVVCPQLSTPTDQRLVVMWESSVVQRAVARLEVLSMTDAVASSVLAIIADQVESVVVLQKNKTFDAESQTLPATSLVFKIVDFVRQHASSEPVESEEDVEVEATTQSVLRCLGRVSLLPALNFAPLVRRTMYHFANVQVTQACLSLAAAHASCVNLVMTDLLVSERLLNSSSEFLSTVTEILRVARARLTSEQQSTLLARTFDAWSHHWQFASRSPEVVKAAEVWTTALADAVVSSDEALATTTRGLLWESFLPRLPFRPQGSTSIGVLQGMAIDVLLKIDKEAGDEDDVWQRLLTLSIDTKAQRGPENWWCYGKLLSFVVNAGGASSQRVGSTIALIGRWLLQQDYGRWIHSTTEARDQLVFGLVSAVFQPSGGSNLSTSRTRKPESSESWLLELLDAFARNLGHLSEQQTRRAHRRAFFLFVNSVVSWQLLCNHEVYQLANSSSPVAARIPEALLSAGLVHHPQLATVWTRLWTLRTQLSQEQALADHAEDLWSYSTAITRIASHTHVLGSADLITGSTHRELI